MNDRSYYGFEDIFRRAIDLNVRYFTAMGKATSDYLSEVASAMGKSSPVDGWSSIFGQTSSTSGDERPSAASGSRPAGASLVLEGKAGETVTGVFMVENSLPQEVTASVVASAFTSASGQQARPAIEYDPPAIALKPGERVLVRATTIIGGDLEPDVRYTAEFHIPQLRGSSIPVVLRRTSNSPR